MTAGGRERVYGSDRRSPTPLWCRMWTANSVKEDVRRHGNRAWIENPRYIRRRFGIDVYLYLSPHSVPERGEGGLLTVCGVVGG